MDVDVVVLDGTGRLVRGLTAEDFELYDEGKLQEVSTFSFVEVEPGLARETIAIDRVVIGSSMTGATPAAAPGRALLQTWPWRVRPCQAGPESLQTGGAPIAHQVRCRRSRLATTC